MTLVDAFRTVAPCLGDDGDTTRNTAASLLHDELKRLAMRLIADARDDCIQTVLLRLVRVGPRGDRPADPDTEGAVRGYLVNALRNAERDVLRLRRSEVAEQIEQPVAPVDLDLQWAHDALVRARSQLRDHCIPGCRDTLRADAAKRFECVLEDRADLVHGRCDLDDVVRRRRGQLSTRDRNAVYQEHSRTLRRLGEYVEWYISEQRLTRADAAALRVAFSELSEWG